MQPSVAPAPAELLEESSDEFSALDSELFDGLSDDYGGTEPAEDSLEGEESVDSEELAETEEFPESDGDDESPASRRLLADQTSGLGSLLGRGAAVDNATSKLENNPANCNTQYCLLPLHQR